MQEPLAGEIVVVRRKNAWEDDDQPHGVWKIAYADFMTAMMAFFLVMWLINVTDDSVRRGVAQYFNPVKLASTAPNQKGLNDPAISGATNEGGSGEETGELAPPTGDGDEPVTKGDMDAQSQSGAVQTPAAADSQSGQFSQVFSETQIFIDPYAVLDTLAQKVVMRDADRTGQSAIGAGLDREAGAQGGEAYRDPFDPLYWQFVPNRGIAEADRAEPLQQTRNIEIDTAASSGSTGEGPYDSVRDVFSPQNTGSGNTGPSLTGPSEAATQDTFDSVTETLTAEVSGQTPKIGDGPRPQVENGQGPSAAPMERTPVSEPADRLPEDGAGQTDAQTVAELRDELKNAEGTVLEETAARVEVTRTDEGILVSLTDDQNFEMFAIGSAEPRPELVALLKNLGGVLAEKPGQIVVKGHTDARPFRSKNYDNWRLSTARAHMALYMLTRGGVDKERFGKVEGYADRELKNPDDPNDAVNRRIEILLREAV
ncbi:chemotaxis protein MotB [Roseibium hamelinense]|uniref:Chemotaxis protein MotB n=1 Tax=Roseibium hamelinense TaxID=150831 RepID=A0A562TIA1_9HYPH|nr:MotB family protein [Roseibium hamelinense]MTI45917.1 MotB family protein [Roseibium hamelinense]TWI92898.1 chemotaxis protein MotB [Roseibium hamelinense]